MGLCLFPDSSYLEQIGSDMKYNHEEEKEKLQFEIIAHRETYDKVLAERVQMVKELARARHMMDWYAKLFEEASLKVTQHATELAAARKTIEEMREALEKAREGISASYEEAPLMRKRFTSLKATLFWPIGRGKSCDTRATPSAPPSPRPTRRESPMRVRIDYTNWRGERSIRLVKPLRLEFENSEWHPETQWVLYAVDLDKGVERVFAMKDLHSWEPVHE